MEKKIVAFSLLFLVGCSSIPKDKQQHFAAGVISSGIVFKITGDTNKGCATAVGLGAAKEMYDSQHPNKHTVDVNDFIATSLGCLVWKFFKE